MSPLPCALYRHFDATGRLLYVGISLSAAARASQHRKAPWFAEMATMTTEWHPSRKAAGEAERIAIRDEMPLHNRQRYGAPQVAIPSLPVLKSNAPLPAYVATWGIRNVEIAMGSARRRRLFAEGKLTPLDHDKWDAGGYGPDPFGIAARRAEALSTTPSN